MPNKVAIYGGPNFQWYLLTALIFLVLGVYAMLGWIIFNILTFAFVYLYLRYRHIPIITSLLDTDWYKLTMGQVVFHRFPAANAVYRFYNRGKTEFPIGFAEALRTELEYLSKVSLSNEELMWLEDQNVLRDDYLIFLENYRFKPDQVKIEQKDGQLEIMVEGLWTETILWEVPLMAIISELYFRMTGRTFDPAEFLDKTKIKADKMRNANVKWSDFGTRRRFSKETQSALNSVMRHYAPNFIGTSNPYFAMRYGLTPIGTYAHEAVMAMQALYGAAESNIKWMECWWEEYKDYPHLLTALTDTLTTEVFLRTYTGDMLNKYTGVRQDSGVPIIFGMQLLEHYKKHNINPKEKKIVFSDSLDADKACCLQTRFGDEIPCVMGIGTNLTNDCGHKPLNMVIKLVAIDFGDGLKTVVKLSDDKGKHTGDCEKIAEIKKELGL
jgi:nicotinate phosphoribosyltransferase